MGIAGRDRAGAAVNRAMMGLACEGWAQWGLIMSDERLKAELRQVLNVPDGAASYLDQAAFYRLNINQPFSQVHKRFQTLEPRFNSHDYFFAGRSEPIDTQAAYVLYTPVTHRDGVEPQYLGVILFRATGEQTRIDGIEDSGNDPLFQSELFEDFWRLFEPLIRPPSYDEVIKYLKRARGRNPKITLKEVCNRLGANYNSVNAAASRARRKKRGT